MEGKVIVKRSKVPSSRLVASDLTHKTVRCITSIKQRIHNGGGGGGGYVVLFIATTAALELVRRFSKNNFPFIWRGLQLLQPFSYPPFSCLQKLPLFKDLITNVQKVSRPMLFLSIATLFSDDFSCDPEAPENLNTSQSQSDISSNFQNPSTRYHNEIAGNHDSDKWLVELITELTKEGITVPERLSNEDLRRFYDSVNGDFSRFLSSVKRTIRWRQTYTMFSTEELQAWSRWIFWHGCDVNSCRCLIVRLGLACSNLRSDCMPLFAKAVVSQIEDGIGNLNDADHPQITVLMDCDGLSPFGFPVHMMRSCAMLLQDHYPNRLGSLIIVRLPQIARVVTQTLFQVLKPATRKKLRIIGRNYTEILSQLLEAAPSFLGGSCTCSKCCDSDDLQAANEEMSENPRNNLAEVSFVDVPGTSDGRHGDGEDAEICCLDTSLPSDGRVGDGKDHFVRIFVIITLVSLFIFFVLGKCIPM